MNHFSEKVSFIWGVADLLRGDYKQSEYGRVILPFLVLRRLDQVLDPTREPVRETYRNARKLPEALRHTMVMKASGVGFYNTSRLDFPGLLQDPDNIAANLDGFLAGFSHNVWDIMERFRFGDQVTRLDNANLLFLVARRFAEIDLHPYRRHPDGSLRTGPDGKPEPNVTNHEMGYLFEELIRRFSEQSNETAGEHFTPREVIRLMLNLLFAEDDPLLHTPGIVRTMYDPACGTGGMVSVAEDHRSQLNPQARLEVYGQELNDESYAICKADRLVKGQAADNIKRGNSFADDGLSTLRADYLISSPDTLYKDREAFTKALKAAARAQGVKLAAPVQKAVLSALSERDETAEVCLVKGQPEPDPELRDYENVSLGEDIGAYMEREVLPHVSDAWVDHSKTKVGYEIPFTRRHRPARHRGGTMSDLKLFRLEPQGVTQLAASTVALEKSLQTLMEAKGQAATAAKLRRELS